MKRFHIYDSDMVEAQDGFWCDAEDAQKEIDALREALELLTGSEPRCKLRTGERYGTVCISHGLTDPCPYGLARAALAKARGKT
jgi:hypothetical protein